MDYLGGRGKIKDATAIPSDVMNGKIFYNNDGRQVGSNDNEKHILILFQY